MSTDRFSRVPASTLLLLSGVLSTQARAWPSGPFRRPGVTAPAGTGKPCGPLVKPKWFDPRDPRGGGVIVGKHGPCPKPERYADHRTGPRDPVPMVRPAMLARGEAQNRASSCRERRMQDRTWRQRCFGSLLLGIAASVAAADDAAQALALTDAQTLAVTRQPMLQAHAAAVDAARDAAVAAAQLPDPKLTGGISSWPIDGPERYSLRRDNFTMFNVGIEQDFPRAAKRQLRGARGEHEAELAEQTLIANRLAMQRDAALAWLEVWRPERALELTQASVREAELQVQAAEIAYAVARATQADMLAAQVTLGLLRDAAASLEDESQMARSKLSRWIGADAAQRPLYADIPAWPTPAPLESLLTRLRSHPHLDTEAKRVEIARDDVALARQAYTPDWRAGLGYGYRPDFSDYVSINVSIDLPVFTGQRQNRELGAKLAAQTQAEQAREDMFRQAEADLRRNWLGWQRLQARIRQFDEAILPQSQQRIDAALAAWQAGQGTLVAVLDARRMALDNRLKRLDLVTDAARYRVALQYFAGDSL